MYKFILTTYFFCRQPSVAPSEIASTQALIWTEAWDFTDEIVAALHIFVDLVSSNQNRNPPQSTLSGILILQERFIFDFS